MNETYLFLFIPRNPRLIRLTHETMLDGFLIHEAQLCSVLNRDFLHALPVLPVIGTMHTNLALEQKTSLHELYRENRAKVSHCVFHLLQRHRRWESLAERKRTLRENFLPPRSNGSMKNLKVSKLLICCFFTFKENFSYCTRNLITFLSAPQDKLCSFVGHKKDEKKLKKIHENLKSLKSTITLEHSTENIP